MTKIRRLSQWQNQILQWILLGAVGLLVFGRVTGFDFVPYDDPAYVTGNEFVAKGYSPEGLRWAFFYGSGLEDLKSGGVENLWHPLTWISHMTDAQLFGVENAAGHHAVSLLLYLISAGLVMWVAGMILGNPWGGFWVALLWMLHPLKVESVAWVSERKDVLSGLFFWAALGCAVKSFTASITWRWVGYGLFLAALLSKPSVVVLPGLVLLVEGFSRKEKKWDLDFLVAGLKRWWLWFVSAGVVAMLTIAMQSGGTHEFFSEQSSLLGRLTTAGAGLWFYLWRILVPLNLTFEYPPPAWPHWTFAIAWFGVLAVGITVWRKRAQWRGLFFGLAWFLICWLPVSGLVYVGSSFTADRYLYLGLAGLLIFVVRCFEQVPQKVSLSLGLAFSLLWAALSWKQVGVWKDGWSLFTHTTRAQPKLTTGWVNLGGMYQQEEQWQAAERSYRKAIQLNPSDYTAWFNLGNVRKSSGNIPEAEQAYERAIEIYPAYLPALLNLGLLKRAEGQFEEARDLFLPGIDQDVRMLWLTCESELRLGNDDRAKKLLERLEAQPIRNQAVMDGMKKARTYLNRSR